MLNGARRRCPRCGKEPLFYRWNRVRKGCGACGLRYQINPGDPWGFLLVIDRGALILPPIALIYFGLLPRDPVAIVALFRRLHRPDHLHRTAPLWCLHRARRADLSRRRSIGDRLVGHRVQCLLEGIERQVGSQRSGHAPTDDPTCQRVDALAAQLPPHLATPCTLKLSSQYPIDLLAQPGSRASLKAQPVESA